MAAYRRVNDLTVTCRLTACTPGSAPGPTLGVEYGKPLPLPFYSLSVDSDHTSVGKLLRLSTSAATATAPLLALKHTLSDDDFL